MSALQQGQETREGFSYKKRVLLFEGRLVFAENSASIPKGADVMPEHMWEDISMGFITGLPKSVFVVVDRLSKYSHFIPLKHLYSTRVLAEICTKETVCLHGIPASIVSDRDPILSVHFGKNRSNCKGLNSR